MKMLVTVMLAAAYSITGHTQEKIKSLTLSDRIIYSAIDRPGDFYAITESGQIQRFDKDGNLLLLYKAPQAPTVFDPRDGARLFFYHRLDQTYEYLSPSFQPIVSYKIDPSFAIQPWLICPSGEYKLWILDKTDRSLKKIDIKSSEVELELLLDSAIVRDAAVLKTMREYQSFVFMLNPSEGILIFNSLGRHIRTLDIPNITGFNFLGEELYYIRRDAIEFFNLFTAERRQMKIAPGYTDVLLTDERLILLGAEKIDIFSFRP